MGILNTLLTAVGRRPTHRLSIDFNGQEHVMSIYPIAKGRSIGRPIISQALPPQFQAEDVNVNSPSWRETAGDLALQWARHSGFETSRGWRWETDGWMLPTGYVDGRFKRF